MNALVPASATAVPAAAVAAIATALALACARGNAASIEAISTSRDGGRYAVALRVHLDVPPLAAYAVFADVANWERLSPDLRQLDILDQHRDGARELSMTVQACMLWYCRLLHEVPDVFPAPGADGGDIYVMLRPNTGDFRSGQAHWRFRGSGSGTELQVSAEVEPDFKVPLIIGPWVMTRWLRAEAAHTSMNIEALATSFASLSARHGATHSSAAQP